MLNIIKSKEAEADLEEIWDFIALDNPETATRFLRLLNDQINDLAQNPKIGRERDNLATGLRSLPFVNYLIFYRSRFGGID